MQYLERLVFRRIQEGFAVGVKLTAQAKLLANVTVRSHNNLSPVA